MADYKRTVDDIRSMMRSSDLTRSEEMVRLADDYALACRDVNRRISQCNDCLRRGLRTEAVDMAEAEPKLIDAVEILDFNELVEWLDLCIFNDLAQPVTLLMEEAAAINESYAAVQSLEHLLYKHRLLALMRAPLGMRITLVRQLSVREAEHGFWQTDLQELEAARQREIRDEAERAVARGDLPALRELQAELTLATWSKLSKTLRTSVDAAVEQLARRDAKLQLETLIPDAVECHSAGDYVGAEAIREQCKPLLADAALPANHRLSQMAEPVWTWLDEVADAFERQTRYDDDVRRLAGRLDDDTLSADDLSLLVQAAQSHGVPLPLELQDRVDGRQAADRKKRLLRLQATVGAAVVAAAVVIAGVWFVVDRQLFAHRAAATMASLAEHQAGRDLPAGKALTDRIRATDARLADHPPVAAAMQDWDAFVVRETSRSAEFQGRLRKVQQAPLEGSEPVGAETLRQLAAGDGEKRAVQDALDAWKVRLGTRQVQEARTFETACEELLAAMLAVEERWKAEVYDAREVDDLESTAEQLHTQHRSRGLKPSAGMTAVDARIASLRRGVVNRRRQQEVQQRLAGTLLADRAEDYATALSRAIKELDEHPVANEWRRTLQEDAAIWRAVGRWRDAKDFAASCTGLATPVMAEAQLRRLGPMMDDGERLPVGRWMLRVRAYLQAVRSRTIEGDKPSLKATTAAFFAQPFLQKCWTIRHDGKMFLAAEESKESRTADFRHFKVYSDALGNTKRISLRNDGAIEERTSMHLDFAGRTLVHWLALRSDQINDRPWEDMFVETLGELGRSSSFDPMIRVVMFRVLIRTALDGDPALAEALAPQLRWLATADDQVNLLANWIDPDNTDGAVARKAMASLWTRFPQLDAGQQTAKWRQKLVDDYPEAPVPAGVLVKRAGGWECLIAEDVGRRLPKRPTKLVVYSAATGGLLRDLAVGEWSGKSAALSPSSTALLRQGGLVFLQPPVSTANAR